MSKVKHLTSLEMIRAVVCRLFGSVEFGGVEGGRDPLLSHPNQPARSIRQPYQYDMLRGEWGAV